MATQRKPRSRRASNEDFIEAALERVRKKGFDGLTLRSLADDLGFSVGAVYRYFPNKDALLLAMTAHVVQVIEGDLDLALERVDSYRARAKGLSKSELPLLRLLAAVEAYRTLPVRRPALFHLLARMLGDPQVLVSSDAAADMVPSLLTVVARLQGLISDAEAGGAVKKGPDLQRAVRLWAGVHGIVQLRKLERFGVDTLTTERLARELTTDVLVGWGATPAQVDEMQQRLARLDLDHNLPSA